MQVEKGNDYPNSPSNSADYSVSEIHPLRPAATCVACIEKDKNLKTIIQQNHLLRSITQDILSKIENLKEEVKGHFRAPPATSISVFNRFPNLQFPLNDEDEFSLFEEILKNVENFNDWVTELAKVGGTDNYNFVKQVLHTLITNDSGLKFSWLGRKCKKPFFETNMARLILCMMSNFLIHEDVENNYQHVKAKKTVGAAEGHKQKKCSSEHRETLQEIGNGARIDGKKVKLSKKNDGTGVVKQEKKKQPVVEESFLRVEKDHHSLRPKKERDTFPLSLLHNNEYKQDIWRYLRSMEETGPRPKSSYMAKQVDINWQSRSVLIDWLSSVTEEYKFCHETFHLGVNYIDRFLTHISVVRQKFQLVGAAAMMIATKMEEYQPLDSKEWSFLTGDTFSYKQVLKMEQLILKVLSYKMQMPTIHGFIQQLSTEKGVDEKTLHLAMYLSELVLLEGGVYLDLYPSKLASACVALARHTLSKRRPWPDELREASGYSLRELSPVVQRQQQTFWNSPMREQQAIRIKYSSPKFSKVALMRPRTLLIEEFDEDE